MLDKTLKIEFQLFIIKVSKYLKFSFLIYSLLAVNKGGIGAAFGSKRKVLSKFPKKAEFTTVPKKLGKTRAFKVAKYDANAYNK